MADVQEVIRRFGQICGRPHKERGRPEFNFSLFLRDAAPDALGSVERYLQGASPHGRMADAPAVAAPAAGFGGLDLVDLSFPAAGKPDFSPPFGSGGAAPVPGSLLGPEAPAGPSSPFESVGRASEVPAVPVMEAPGQDKQGPGPAPPSVPGGLASAGFPETPAPVPALETPPRPASAWTDSPPAGPPVGQARSEKPLWGVTVALDQNLTFDSLNVGPFNRFAHAAGMAVVSSPGMMYNPLFLHGNPGVGKTHLLMAIGRGSVDANQATKDGIFFTSGPRLSRAVGRAKAEGRMGELDAFVKKTKALMIDDFHLLSVSDQNQGGLAAIFGHYLQGSKQVVLASAYPPKSLGALEEALKLQLGAGYTVDMKPLNADAQKESLRVSLARYGFDPDTGPANFIAESLAGSNAEIIRWLERLRSLADLRQGSGQPGNIQSLLSLLFVPDLPAGPPARGEELQELSAAMDAPPPAGADARNLAVFFPQGSDVYARFLQAQFHAIAARNGWSFPLRQTAFQPYDPGQLYGVPFTMGDVCDRAGAQAALVVGPNPGSGLADREPEMVHAVLRILGNLDIRLGWIPFLRIKEPLPYFRACLDIYPAFRSPA